MTAGTAESTTASFATMNLEEESMDETTTNYIDVIETVISSLEQNDSAMVSHNQDGYLWKFQYGTVEVYVQLTGLTEEDTITVWSSVLKLPAQDETGLMRKLLEMNSAETFEARYCIVKDEVVVISTRSVEELSPGEISRAITIVATLADENDEPLKEKFGAAA